MPRGGARTGRPGQSYANRTDLGIAKLPAVAAPGQTYGQAGQQIQAQQAMPMGAQPTPSPPQGTGEPPAAVTPGSLGPLNAPSNRPDEPLTAGVPTGPGANSMSLPAPPPDPMLTTLAALSSLGPKLNPALRTTVTQLQATQNNGLGG